MSWFDTSGFTSLAKSALKEAQKTIDKALDIQQEEYEQAEILARKSKPPSEATPIPQKDTSDFFSSWGLTSSNSLNLITQKEQPVITQSPSKTMSHSLWGSFAGSFFESDQNDPNIKNTENNLESPDTTDNNVKNKTGILDNADPLVIGKNGNSNEPKNNVVLRRPSDKTNSSINRLSIVSSESIINSSESIEVLGSQSLKTTPDSEGNSLNNSASSLGIKLASSSVEVIQDSLASPSSIELLGFSHSGSDEEFGSPLTSPIENDKENIAIAHKLKVETSNDNPEEDVKVVDDDEEISAADDTISYNSISEFTSPTILDGANVHVASRKSGAQYCNEMLDSFSSGNVSSSEDVPITRAPSRSVPQFTPTIPGSAQCFTAKLQTSSESFQNILTESYESDHTVNADIESIVLDDKAVINDKLKGLLEEMSDKISDTSSYCKLNDDALKEGAHSCSSQSYEEVDKASSIENLGSESLSHREPTSPVSSDGRSIDLIKLGSEQTSGHTSGDDLETTTSSDIEIIPSPNGEYIYCRQSPGKSNKFSKNQSGNVVDLVLGKALAQKIRGHTRELSGASIQSNTSDDSHCSEVDRLMRRLAEMAEILESREAKLIEISRNNIELNDYNAELKQQIENLNKQDTSDVNVITEEYTQRLSALEKKFQQAIREKDTLRKQMETYKQETASRTTGNGFESILSEKDETIKELREEGEKLSKQQLHHSTIIKRLRAKEKENEQVIKTLRDKVAEQAQELDRQKRLLTSKESAESANIETVYKLTSANKKLENELSEAKSQLDDSIQKFDTAKKSFDAAKKEVNELQKQCTDQEKNQETLNILSKEKATLEMENEQLVQQVDDLRLLMRQEEQRWMVKETNLRSEVSRQLARAEEAESALQLSKSEIGNANSSDGTTSDGGVLLVQLAALQESSLERERRFQTKERRLQQLASDSQNKLAKAVEANQLLKDECQNLRTKLSSMEINLNVTKQKLENCMCACEEHMSQLKITLESSERLKSEFQVYKEETSSSMNELNDKLNILDQQLATEKSSLDAEKRRNTILQEQLKEAAMSMDPTSGSSLLLARLVGTGEVVNANSSNERVGNVSPNGSAGRDSMASESLGSGVWPADDCDSCGMGSVSGTLNETVIAGSDGGLCTLERLQAALQRREGELRAARKAGKRSHAQRTALARELALHAAELDTMQSLQHQYDALLQMYGEKEEQLQELRLDLQDIKDMYKMQLDEILMLKRQVSEQNNQLK